LKIHIITEQEILGRTCDVYIPSDSSLCKQERTINKLLHNLMVHLCE